jgi:ankyrin repeat protein
MSLACSQDASPLHAAVRMSDTAAIRAYLDAHPEQVDVASTSSGHTPLHEAVAGTKCLAAAKLLLSKGADPCAVDPRDGGMAPLHQAVDNGVEPIALELLASGADVRGKTAAEGLTPLHLAARGGHDALARLLIARGGDVNARANDGRTPLHLAAKHGRENTAKILLDNGADAKAKDKKFLTADYEAAKAKNPRVVELILGPKDERKTPAPKKKQRSERKNR